MAYIPEGWADGIAGGTPLQAARLVYMENGIQAAAATADNAQSTASIANTAVANALSVANAAQSTANANASAITTKADTTYVDTQDNALGGRITVLEARPLTTPTLDNLPAGTTITVAKDATTGWPARPTSRTDIVVAWKGQDPSPAIVSSGTGGMLNNVDIRFVTP
jgi:hypothetical protein